MYLQIFLESSEKIYIANFDGEIESEFSKFGDIPDSYGILLSTIRFEGDGAILIYGSNGFFKYSYYGETINRQKLKNYEMPDRSFKTMGRGMEAVGNRYLYINQEFPPNRDYSKKSFLYDLHLLKWLYPDSGEIEPFIQFPEYSLFRNGKLFFRSAWDPAFHVEDGYIYVVFGLEPVIYVYQDTFPYNLVSELPIQFKEFRNFTGTDDFTFEIEAFFDRFRSAFVENIKKIDDLFVIAYFPGYDQQDLSESNENKSPQEREAFLEKIAKKYPNRIAIVDSTGNVINDFVPEGLEPSSMLVRDGQLWMMEKPNEEEEQDYFRLFRVGLKIENQ
ncbi:hypothetical protein A3SI_20052 [Nitritalea halalkaliphila LW7]|uniref:Uncharacterized protein n=1 Tax=Nitritalea halalkaliphila LW7 TaxID=1189621 RepID=I5BR70_9BACT|nr:hypothetical protein [Nitritalea halalkaliphila]EIM72072.1 hypothetical protein A3SI_20052 [Nitritalea halalkaliphila LW7]